MQIDTTTAPEAQAAPRAHPSPFDKLMWVGELQSRRDLTASARRIVVLLAYHHNSTTGRCDPSIATLADEAALSKRMVNTALDELKEAGIIEWIPGNEKTRNKYTLRDVPRRDFPAKATTEGTPVKRGKSPASSSGATVIPFPGPAETDQSSAGGSEPQFTRVVNSTLPGVVNPSSPEPLNSQPQKETSVSSEGPSGVSGKQTAFGSQQATKAKHTTFPDDFTLTDARIKVAARNGISGQDVKAVFEHFRAYHRGKGTRSPNWPEMWLSWCMEHSRRKRASGPKLSAI